MKQTLVVFNFGRSVLRHLRLLPAVKNAHPRPRQRRPSRRDILLERLCRQLLRMAKCPDLKVTVEWNSRLRTTAGHACWRSKTISLNPKLIEVSPAEVQRTLRHELAHFLAQHRAGRRQIAPHGREWRQACKDLGIPNESRCHDLPLKRIRFERRFFYACRECGTTLARVRAMKRHVACLKCCRRHNEGKYHNRFRFVPVPAPERLAA
jgi:SprT protein